MIQDTLLVLSEDAPLLTTCRAVCKQQGMTLQKTVELAPIAAQATPHTLALLPWSEWGSEGLRRFLAVNPSLAVVAVAAAATTDEVTSALRGGAIDYLPAPVDEPTLTQSIQRWRRRSQDHAATANLSEMLTLMELGRTLTSTLQLQELYEQIIEQVQRTFEPDTVSLMLLNERSNSLRIVVQRGLPARTVGVEVTLDEESIAGHVAREGQPLLLLGGLEQTPFEHLARRSADIGSAMSIPLQVKGRTLGVINVNRAKGRPSYSQKDATMLHIFASQIAIALQNAQLYESIRQERDRIIEAQEEVRRELARDLHDGLTQVLATLATRVDFLQMLVEQGNRSPAQVAEDLGDVRAMARQAIHDARTLTFGLRPLVLETKGLVVALEQYLDAMQTSDPRDTLYHFEATNCPSGVWLPPNVARMVFAILQEAINNARKHAKATNLWVRLHCEGSAGAPMLRATVQDDGQGFDLAQVEGNYEERLSFGLHNMRERASLIDATYHMASRPGQGTTIELRLPLPLISDPTAL